MSFLFVRISTLVKGLPLELLTFKNPLQRSHGHGYPLLDWYYSLKYRQFHTPTKAKTLTYSNAQSSQTNFTLHLVCISPHGTSWLAETH